MPDYSGSKSYGTAVYPVHANATSGLLKRCEPLLTPEKLISRHLKGIPLAFPNGDVITKDDLKDRINLAQNEVELLIKATLTPEQRKEKHPFDRALYVSWIHVKTEQGPIASIEQLAIVAANGEVIFNIPAEWIETANFAKRQINVVPLLSAFGAHTVEGAPTNAGIAFLAMMERFGMVPAYWEVIYTAGVTNKEGNVPVPVNELVGVVAALEVLSQIATQFIYNSQSLSQDGISQSSSGPGPNVYARRIEELELKKKDLMKKLKAIFFGNFVTSNI